MVTQIDYIKDPKTLKEIPGQISISQPSGLTWISQFSKNYGQNGADFGAVMTQTSVNGRVSTVHEDFVLNTAQITTPVGRIATMQYTPTRLLESIVVPGLETTRYQYDSRGRLAAETTGTRTIRYNHNQKGQTRSK